MNEREQCLNIYHEAFSKDDTAFRDKLFNYCFEYCRFIKNGQDIAAILFALPCKIFAYGKEYKASYIFAAATAMKYRNMGFMKRLLKETEDENQVLFLYPATKELYGFYEKLGYVRFSVTTNYNSECYAEPQLNFKRLIEGDNIEDLDKNYIAMYRYDSEINIENMFFPYIME